MSDSAVKTNDTGSQQRLASHTPGPWCRRFGKGQYAEEVFAKSARGKDIVIARIASGIEKRESDARLIAAAPDLLAALEEIIAAADADILHDAAADRNFKESRQIIAARAVLAKAKGGK